MVASWRQRWYVLVSNESVTADHEQGVEQTRGADDGDTSGWASSGYRCIDVGCAQVDWVSAEG